MTCGSDSSALLRRAAANSGVRLQHGKQRNKNFAPSSAMPVGNSSSPLPTPSRGRPCNFTMKEDHMNASDVFRYRKPVTFLLVAWFVFAVATSAAGFYRPGAGPLPAPAPVGLSVLLPVVIFWIWMATSPSFRAFALSLSPQFVTIVQSWRVLGFVFPALAAN